MSDKNTTEKLARIVCDEQDKQYLLTQSDFEKITEFQKIALEQIKTLKQFCKKAAIDNEKLSEEIQSFSVRQEQDAKNTEVKSLVDYMVENGLISESDRDSKTAEFTKMDRSSFDILKDTIQKINVGEKNASFSTLDFLVKLDGKDSDAGGTKTMLESFSQNNI